MSDIVRPDIVNYTTVPQHNGRYRFKRTPPSTGSSSFSLQATSATPLQWKIPALTVFNPSRMSLDYTKFNAADGTKGMWSFEDTVAEINSLTFGPVSGPLHVDLPFASEYLNSVRKLDTSQVEFEGNDYISGLYKAKSNAPPDNYFTPTMAWVAPNNFNELVGASVTAPFTTPEACYSRYTGLAAGLTTVRSIPFSAFKGTLLAMDRDMMFVDDQYLTIQFASSARSGFVTTAPGALGGETTAFAVQPAISNLYLNIAVQVDPAVEAYVRNGFASGKLSFIFPWVHTSKIPGGATGQQAISITYPANLGQKLKRIIHVPYSAAGGAGGSKQYDHQNLNGAKVNTYRTSMDSNPLQDNVMSCLQPVCDDYRENRQLLKGSAIENSGIYYLNWMHIDSFSQPKRDAELPTDNVLEGLDMDGSRQWVFEGYCTAGLVFHTFATFVRRLQCRPDGTITDFKF